MRRLAAVLALALLLPGCFSGGDEDESRRGGRDGRASAMTCEKTGNVFSRNVDTPQAEPSEQSFEVAPGCGLLLRVKFTGAVGSARIEVLKGGEVVMSADKGGTTVGNPDARDVYSPAPAGSYSIRLTPGTPPATFTVQVEADHPASIGDGG